jgi:hypothetical protein
MEGRLVTRLGVLTIFVAGYSLFAIKGQVNDLSYQFADLTKQINEERSNINILKAENAYLQSPNRLKSLSEKYLGLASIKTDQMIKDPLLVEEKTEEGVVQAKTEQTAKALKKVSWRYKHRNSNYLTTVSHKR